MDKRALIANIVSRLIEEGVLDAENYADIEDQCEDVAIILERELDGYIFVKGEIIK